MQYKLENVGQYLWGYCTEINNRLLQRIRKLAFRSFGSIENTVAGTSDRQLSIVLLLVFDHKYALDYEVGDETLSRYSSWLNAIHGA